VGCGGGSELGGTGVSAGVMRELQATFVACRQAMSPNTANPRLNGSRRLPMIAVIPSRVLTAVVNVDGDRPL
jgi:hypothetical protein